MIDCSKELTNNELHKIQSQDFRIGGRVEVRPYATDQLLQIAVVCGLQSKKH